MISIGVVTVGRSDYGIYRSLLQKLRGDERFELRLYVSGMHLSPEFGHTVDDIARDGFPIFERIEMLEADDTPEAIGKSIGRGVAGFSQAFARSRPDILVVLGDRFEMFAAAVAALPFGLPVAHIHGGEVTVGAIDEALRHSLTKMSHLHFVSTEEYARRVVQLGEDPDRVTVCGAPALDGLEAFVPSSPADLEERFQISLREPPLLVTFHPVTIEYDEAAQQIRAVLDAIAASGRPAIFSAPNADTASRSVRSAVVAFVAERDRAWLVENFGRQSYFSMMKYSAAMVGNSSSGLIEAGSFGLPVVNIGQRQTGRVRGQNVLDTPCQSKAIEEAIRRAVSPDFKASLSGLQNPYRNEDQDAATLIVERLARVRDVRDLILKHFYDLK